MFGKPKTPYASFSIFFLVGGVIGAAIALLYAPTTGRKLQKQIKEVWDDQLDNVQGVVKRVVNA